MIKITGIESHKPLSGNSVTDHLSIERFAWVGDESQRRGIITRESLFDFVYDHGEVFLINKEGETVRIFGAFCTPKKKYVRCIKHGRWTDDLLSLPQIGTLQW